MAMYQIVRIDRGLSQDTVEQICQWIDQSFVDQGGHDSLLFDFGKIGIRIDRVKNNYWILLLEENVDVETYTSNNIKQSRTNRGFKSTLKESNFLENMGWTTRSWYDEDLFVVKKHEALPNQGKHLSKEELAVIIKDASALWEARLFL